MAKYLVETYYNCSFKVSHYLDKVDEKELSNLEKVLDPKWINFVMSGWMIGSPNSPSNDTLLFLNSSLFFIMFSNDKYGMWICSNAGFTGVLSLVVR